MQGFITRWGKRILESECFDFIQTNNCFVLLTHEYCMLYKPSWYLKKAFWGLISSPWHQQAFTRHEIPKWFHSLLKFWNSDTTNKQVLTMLFANDTHLFMPILNYEDGSFDFALVHSWLTSCESGIIFYLLDTNIIFYLLDKFIFPIEDLAQSLRKIYWWRPVSLKQTIG